MALVCVIMTANGLMTGANWQVGWALSTVWPASPPERVQVDPADNRRLEVPCMFAGVKRSAIVRAAFRSAGIVRPAFALGKARSGDSRRREGNNCTLRAIFISR